MAITAVIVVVVLFFNTAGGSFIKLLEDPSRVIFLTFPFVPVAILSWMAKRIEIKLGKYYSDVQSKKGT